MPVPVSTAEFAQAMGQHVSSVCVITTRYKGERFGLTATAVSSVSASPPRLLVCVNKSGLTHEKITAAGHFGVNVLAEAQQKVGESFAGMLGRNFDRFTVGEWKEGPTGSPILDDAASSFDCKIVERLDQNSHSIFIGEVVGAYAGLGRDALVYGARRFRTLRKIMQAPLTEDMEFLNF